MNKLEKLSMENSKNYIEYLQRMNTSLSVTTKGLIPFLAKKYHNILDVGCADGVLTKSIKEENPAATVIGIDINAEAVERAKENGVDAYHMSLGQVDRLGAKFDCIVFSSVLHEFSSYDTVNPFSAIPIENALEQARKVLTDDGVIIIRDGISVSSIDSLGVIFSYNPVRVEFSNPKDLDWLLRFLEESPAFSHKNAGISSLYGRMNNKLFFDYTAIQEFLATWTWGPESWPREINEKFCILPKKGWKKVFQNTGFDSIYFSTSKEEYPKYLKPKITIYNEDDEEIFPDMTFLAILKKKN